MKKFFALFLALVFVLGIAGAALAAPTNPFVDVPAKHWAYDAVNKLAKAGIVDGYGDGTFRGDRTMTRYEMAQAVAKAMARSDKADAEMKALIDKLAVEFAAELNNLGVRVTKLEEKTRIGWNFESRIRYTDDGKTSGGNDFTSGTDRFDWRQRIILSGEINDNVSYVARLETQKADQNRNHNVLAGTPGSQNIGFNLAYFNVNNFLGTFDQLSIGRIDTRGVTNGLLNGKDANNDGVKVTKKFGEATFNFLFTDQAAQSEIALYNLDFKLADNLKVNLGYQVANLENVLWPLYPFTTVTGKSKSSDVGIQWKVGDFYLTGEYVRTRNDQGGDRWTDIGYAYQITNGITGYLYPTYNLVDPKKAHTDAFSISYRKVEGGATPIMSAFNAASPRLYCDLDTKGTYLTYQNVISKGVVWTAEYQSLTRLISGNKYKTWNTSFQFFF